ncbi:MAG: hypothetical protein GX640_06685 [Fibrobacter sp.]|nr:hypothetical protein [Fibrobacter sp.]
MKRQRKQFVTFMIILSLSVIAAAQDSSTVKSGWKYSIYTNLTLSLNGYSDNWDGGEFSAFSWALQFTGTAEKALTSWFTDKNTLKLAFGQTALQERNAETGDKEWQKLKKSSDLIDFESVGSFTLKAFLDPFISFRAVSQFADIRDTTHTYYINPATLTESFGALRNLMKGERVDWSLRLGGALRQSIDRSLPDSFKVTNDGGIELVTDFKASTKDNRISYLTQVKVYDALFSSASDKLEGTSEENFWRYPDVSWENTLGINLSKYIMLNMYFQLLYDREIDKKVRTRENIGISLTYSVKN